MLLLLILQGYWWINTKGTPAKANEAPIIVGNHTSFIEPIFLGSTFLCFGVSRIENGNFLKTKLNNNNQLIHLKRPFQLSEASFVAFK